MSIIEIEYGDLAAHVGHRLTITNDGELTLYCETCSEVILAADLPTYRAKVTLIGTALVTRTAASEYDMEQLVESMDFPGDEDDIDIMVTGIEIEEY